MDLLLSTRIRSGEKLRDLKMAFTVPINLAQQDYPDYTFIAALTPSAQKAAFHVQDKQGKDLCFKIIAPNYRIDRLEREILALQNIAHPNIVKLIEYTSTTVQGRHRHYMIEEFIDGEDLAYYLGPGKQWPAKKASAFFSMMCDGLAAIKNDRIVHRDLKPSNIRVRRDDSPVIIDFGVARHLDLPDITKTIQGAAIGTWCYFAPEQFVGTKYDIDHRTDLFALGILLYYALVGRHPFYQPGMSYAQCQDAICDSYDYLLAPKFTALSDNWRLISGRLLEKERSKRPYSASQVGEMLRKIGRT